MTKPPTASVRTGNKSFFLLLGASCLLAVACETAPSKGSVDDAPMETRAEDAASAARSDPGSASASDARDASQSSVEETRAVDGSLADAIISQLPSNHSLYFYSNVEIARPLIAPLLDLFAIEAQDQLLALIEQTDRFAGSIIAIDRDEKAGETAPPLTMLITEGAYPSGLIELVLRGTEGWTSLDDRSWRYEPSGLELRFERQRRIYASTVELASIDRQLDYIGMIGLPARAQKELGRHAMTLYIPPRRPEIWRQITRGTLAPDVESFVLWIDPAEPPSEDSEPSYMLSGWLSLAEENEARAFSVLFRLLIGQLAGGRIAGASVQRVDQRIEYSDVTVTARDLIDFIRAISAP